MAEHRYREAVASARHARSDSQPLWAGTTTHPSRLGPHAAQSPLPCRAPPSRAGLMDYAFEYVTKNGGLDTESDYGYWSFDLPCQSAKESDRHVVSIDGFQDVPPGSHAALKAAVAHQPVSVAICANSALQFYSSGVFSADACCQQLNHGVLAVGYQDGDAAGAGSGNWLVKNSWGTGAPSSGGGGGGAAGGAVRLFSGVCGGGVRLAAPGGPGVGDCSACCKPGRPPGTPRS